MVYVGKLLLNDLKNIVRDRFLLYAAVALPLGVVILCRLVLPWLSENMFPLEPFYPILFMLFVIFVPLIFGFITAFLIMDERDENLLTVLRVMPISRSAYLIYRMFFMIVLSFLYVLFFPALTSLIDIGIIEYVPIAVLLALFTPIMALIVNIFANNKVQAFAIFKLLGGIFFLPLFAFYIADNLKYVFGVIPNFWTFMALDTVLATGSNDYAYIGIGVVIHLAFIAVLFYFFNRKY